MDETSQQLNAQPPQPKPTAEEARLLKLWTDEYDFYTEERKPLVGAIREAEKNYDNLLVALSTGSLAATYTLVQYFHVAKPSGLLVVAWVALGLALFTALVDRLLTYYAHTRWLKILDAQFNGWTEGALERARKAYDQIPGIRVLDHLKWFALSLLTVGVLLTMIFFGSSTPTKPETQAQATPSAPLTGGPNPINPASNVVVNVYNGPASGEPHARLSSTSNGDMNMSNETTKVTQLVAPATKGTGLGAPTPMAAPRPVAVNGTPAPQPQAAQPATNSKDGGASPNK